MLITCTSIFLIILSVIFLMFLGLVALDYLIHKVSVLFFQFFFFRKIVNTVNTNCTLNRKQFKWISISKLKIHATMKLWESTQRLQNPSKSKNLILITSWSHMLHSSSPISTMIKQQEIIWRESFYSFFCFFKTYCWIVFPSSRIASLVKEFNQESSILHNCTLNFNDKIRVSGVYALWYSDIPDCIRMISDKIVTETQASVHVEAKQIIPEYVHIFFTTMFNGMNSQQFFPVGWENSQMMLEMQKLNLLRNTVHQTFLNNSIPSLKLFIFF